jgi:hypothetical protein
MHETSRMNRYMHPLLLSLAVTLSALPMVSAAAAGADLTGFWERRDTVGGGSFGGILEKLPKAVLVQGFVIPEPPPPPPIQEKPNPEGVPYVVTSGRCFTSANLGIPFMMTHSSPIDIVQTDAEILIVPELPGAQHIYLDGRGHPPAGLLASSGLGHSVGHWEGDTLVVHTVGMAAGGGIPGGGYRTPETELTQRFRLKQGGKQLEVQFTWADPKIFQQPHTFVLDYFRMPPETYALEEWCDSGDPLQRQSIVPPKQD